MQTPVRLISFSADGAMSGPNISLSITRSNRSQIKQTPRFLILISARCLRRIQNQTDAQRGRAHSGARGVTEERDLSRRRCLGLGRWLPLQSGGSPPPRARPKLAPGRLHLAAVRAGAGPRTGKVCVWIIIAHYHCRASYGTHRPLGRPDFLLPQQQHGSWITDI